MEETANLQQSTVRHHARSGGQQQFIGTRVVSSDDRHRVNHIRVLTARSASTPGDAQAWLCGSNQSAVALLHQMLTSPCNTQRAVLVEVLSLWGLWGMACVCLEVCITYVEICVAPWMVPLRQGVLTCLSTTTWFIQGMWQSRECWLIVWKLAATRSWYCLAALA
jgi:hypothetical protein